MGWSRKKATVIITAGVLILGAIVSLGFGPLGFIKILGLGLLDFFDFISNSVLMPIVAILTCICIGHFVGPKTVSDEVELNGSFKMKKFLYDYVEMDRTCMPGTGSDFCSIGSHGMD